MVIARSAGLISRTTSSKSWNRDTALTAHTFLTPLVITNRSPKAFEMTKSLEQNSVYCSASGVLCRGVAGGTGVLRNQIHRLTNETDVCRLVHVPAPYWRRRGGQAVGNPAKSERFSR